MNRIRTGITLLLAAAFFLGSCAVQSIVIKPGYDFSRIRRVAVLKFNDASFYRDSGSMVSELFVKHLLSTGYDVVEREELDSLLREQDLARSGVLNREQIKQFGKIAGIDAIIVGSISTYVPERDFYENGNPRFIAAQAGLTCRMISVETGEILWAGSNTYDAMNTQTAFDYLISSIVHQLMKDLAKRP